LIYEPLTQDWSVELLNHFTLQGLAFQLKPGRLPGRRFKVRNSPDARISSKLGAILGLDAPDLLVSAKVGVLRHVGRVLAGLRVTAKTSARARM
jgi:hypothetical protein